MQKTKLVSINNNDRFDFDMSVPIYREKQNNIDMELKSAKMVGVIVSLNNVFRFEWGGDCCLARFDLKD